MADSTIVRAIIALKQIMADHSEAAMLYPKADPYDHGSQVGCYHGVLKAVNVLEDLLRDNDDKE